MSALAALRRRDVYDADHEAFRESAARFLVDVGRPSAARWASGAGSPSELFPAAAEFGFVGMLVPESLGGAGVDDPLFASILVEEAMAAGLPELALAFGLHNAVAVPLLSAAAEPQRSRWLREAAAGTLAVALVGFDAPLAATRTSTGWLVSGTASHVLDAASAGVALVAVREAADGDVFLLAVETAQAGVERESLPSLIGFRGADLARVTLEDVEVRDDARLGAEPGEALFRGAQRAMRLTVAVAAVAGTRAALLETSAYVKDRRVFGEPLASFENTRIELAEVASSLVVVESFLDRCLGDARAGRLTDALAAVLKLRATSLYSRTVDVGVQLHGGYGYMWEYPIARSYVDARVLAHLGGARVATLHDIAPEG